ncbi:MAG TPA: hypothetical protein VD793_00395 [Gemmatimonadales bacterium]|nr:hypothetical protein [Gemmatimonadales bacterium]
MKRWTTYSAGLWALATVGCSDGAGPGRAVSLSFATQLPAGALGTPAAFGSPSSARLSVAGDTLRDGTNTLVIESAQMVLREIELERQEVVDCDTDPEPAGCEDFEIGPVLVDLPLGPGVTEQVVVDLPPGTYTEVEFEIHKISKDGQEDAAFRAAHPDFAEKSIRVTGTFNGAPFTFESDLDVEQELDLSPALVIADSVTATNLTIRVGLANWFRALNGSLVNPASGNKGGSNESLVKENIKQSIEAFEDRDEDGSEL